MNRYNMIFTRFLIGLYIIRIISETFLNKLYDEVRTLRFWVPDFLNYAAFGHRYAQWGIVFMYSVRLEPVYLKSHNEFQNLI